MEMLCKELEQIVNSDDPLNKLKQNVGNKSLKEWLKIGYGDALRECMATKLSVGIKYLTIMDAIIPPVPKFMNNIAHKIIFNESSTPNEDLEQLEHLISTLEQVFFTMINNTMFSNGIGTQVLVKVVYYGGKQTIKDNFVKKKLLYFIKTHLGQSCSDFAHIAIALTSILVDKLPEIWQNIFQSRIFSQMNMMVMQNGHNKCLYVNHLQEQLFRKYPALRELKDIAFNEKCLSMALRSSAQIINENEFQYQHFLLSGLMHKFHTLLCSPSEIGEKTFVIKSFLTVFLCFETDIETNYTLKSDLFKKLVKLVVNALDFLLNNLGELRIRNDAVVAAELLESLYVLNIAWHQWFDIAVENKIIKDYVFKSRMLTSFAATFIGLESVHDSFLLSLIGTCPDVVEKKNKKRLFLRTHRHFEYKEFEVSRSNILNDVAEKFREDYASYDWDISFKDEIANGKGVTREVYTILSENLQKHCIGFPRDKTVKLSDDEVIRAESPNGVLPKLNEEIERFELLGKLMAKVIVDGQFLDKSVFRSGFFRQLRASQFKKYSHLRRDYFDLIETFPILENLFKQLLPVKRKVEAIRSEVGLSENQKKEIISNLTFEDGNNFDDLCLNFTVPGTDIELVEGGHNVLLSPHNIDLYFEKLCALNVQLYSESQIEAVRLGFDKVLFPGSIGWLSPEELELSVCGEEIKRWTEEDLIKHCSYEESPSVHFLFQCLASFDSEEQKLFLMFVTGRKSLPHGGLSWLTISRIRHENPDSYLPSATTCRNKLHLPEYSSLTVTRQRLLYAIHESNKFFSFA